jgi:hypothetical protein
VFVDPATGAVDKGRFSQATQDANAAARVVAAAPASNAKPPAPASARPKAALPLQDVAWEAAPGVPQALVTQGPDEPPRAPTPVNTMGAMRNYMRVAQQPPTSRELLSQLLADESYKAGATAPAALDTAIKRGLGNTFADRTAPYGKSVLSTMPGDSGRWSDASMELINRAQSGLPDTAQSSLQYVKNPDKYIDAVTKQITPEGVAAVERYNAQEELAAEKKEAALDLERNKNRNTSYEYHGRQAPMTQKVDGAANAALQTEYNKNYGPGAVDTKRALDLQRAEGAAERGVKVSEGELARAADERGIDKRDRAAMDRLRLTVTAERATADADRAERGRTSDADRAERGRTSDADRTQALEVLGLSHENLKEIEVLKGQNERRARAVSGEYDVKAQREGAAAREKTPTPKSEQQADQDYKDTLGRLDPENIKAFVSDDDAHNAITDLLEMARDSRFPKIRARLNELEKNDPKFRARLAKYAQSRAQ